MGVDSEKPKLEELGLAIGPKYSNNNKINIIKWGRILKVDIFWYFIFYLTIKSETIFNPVRVL